MKQFNEADAKLILDAYIQVILDDDEEIAALQEQNPELMEACFALHRFAYGSKETGPAQNDCGKQ